MIQHIAALIAMTREYSSAAENGSPGGFSEDAVRIIRKVARLSQQLAPSNYSLNHHRVLWALLISTVIARGSSGSTHTLPTKRHAGNVFACTWEVLRPWSNGVLRVSEDCLYLNVWTTVARWEHEMAPVLVWIHGGGFTSGSASYDNYSAAVLAAKTGCVVASINYRLGILGFLNADTPDAPGNVGLMDQRVALLWLRQNARVFGGDPAAITVFGHSAGGMSIHSHMLSPFGGNLFHRAVMMSGNMAARDFFESVEESAAKADAVAALVGCAQATLSRGPREVLACLRTKPSGDLVRAAARAVAPKVFPFLPTYHTDYLPRVPVAATAKGFVANVDLLLGVTENEGSTPFVLRMKAHMQSERLTDVAESALRASLHDVVRAWTKGEQLEMLDLYVRQAKGQRVTQKAGTPSWIGVGHSMELPYFFGHPVINRVGFSQQDEQYSEEVMKMLSTFAHTG
ncbi:hypothetical protein MRX96_034943 [Rhipicephalus microplus]